MTATTMKVIEIQFTPWDKKYDFDPQNHVLKIGDRVIVKTELGTEMGKVMGFREEEKDSQKIKPILRKAMLSDLERMKEKQNRNQDALKYCRKLIKKYKLPMKLIDVRFSFDGSRVIFAFTSKERLDFRDLAKDLTHQFQKSVKLHQIEVRKEAKMCGGVGMCGRELCCAKFLKNLGSVTSDLVRDQQLTYRGSERLSGPCGRLMCCLTFEECYYQETIKILPAIGSIVKTDRGSGEVVGWHVFKRSVDVRIDKETTVEIGLENIKNVNKVGQNSAKP